MPLKLPKPQFEHRPVKGLKDRIVSFCNACKDFIAASNNRKALKIAEKAHRCSVTGHE
jgi:hypothetical protein